MPRIMSCIVRLAALAGVAGALVICAPGGPGLVLPAAAQDAAVSADFRTALDPYGAWHHNRRFGDVWIPANLSRDWRPYTAGRWVYTDDYGWYWVADDQEADWGWITYHYGRWYHDADEGWIWIPNDVWGPAWVDWRYGDQYVGWAPVPPDEFVAEAQDDPTYWSFVTAGNLIAPRIATVLLPFERRAEFFRRTMVVNRPVMMRGPDRHFAVNPGIPPGNIAAIRGRPLPTYRVRPHVLAGTGALPGAVQVRAADLRRPRKRQAARSPRARRHTGHRPIGGNRKADPDGAAATAAWARRSRAPRRYAAACSAKRHRGARHGAAAAAGRATPDRIAATRSRDPTAPGQYQAAGCTAADQRANPGRPASGRS